MRFIDDCKHWWRLWSVRIQAIGAAWMAWLLIAPETMLQLWMMVSPESRAVLPRWLVVGMPLALFVLATLARLVKQPKLEAKRDAAR